MVIRPYNTKNEKGIEMMKKIGSFIIGTVLALSMSFAVVSAASSGTYTTNGGTLGTTSGSYQVGIAGSQSTYSRPYATLTSKHNSYLRIYNLTITLNGNVTSISSIANNNSKLCEWTQTYAPGAVTRIQCNFENTSTYFGSWSGSAWYPN